MGRGFPFGGRCRPAFPGAPLAMMAFFKLFEALFQDLVELFLLFLGENLVDALDAFDAVVQQGFLGVEYFDLGRFD